MLVWVCSYSDKDKREAHLIDLLSSGFGLAMKPMILKLVSDQICRPVLADTIGVISPRLVLK